MFSSFTAGFLARQRISTLSPTCAPLYGDSSQTMRAPRNSLPASTGTFALTTLTAAAAEVRVSFSSEAAWHPMASKVDH